MSFLGNNVTVTVNWIIRDRILLPLYTGCIAMMTNQTSLSPDQYFYFCWESGPNISPETFLFFKFVVFVSASKEMPGCCRKLGHKRPLAYSLYFLTR